MLTDKNGRIPDSEIERKIGPKAKIVAVAYVSNVLGTRFPIERIADRAHEMGAFVILDCAQGFLHYGLDVTQLGADFCAFSAHKALGPDGVGALWGRPELLAQMPPFMRGAG